MNGLLLVSVLCVAGALPILPGLLGKASRNSEPAERRSAKVLAWGLLFACFVVTSGEVLAGFVAAFGKFGDEVIFGGAVAFFIVGASLSYWVAFGPDKPD